MASQLLPYCFKCNKEMRCLKTGFRFNDGYNSYNTDLFHCPICGALATNSCFLDNEPYILHYENGRFSEQFYDFVKEWYPTFYPKFLSMNYNTEADDDC